MIVFSQEPILFDCSIRENIVYGIQDGVLIPHDQIVRACQLANIHQFVLSLPMVGADHIYLLIICRVMTQKWVKKEHN